MKRKRCVCVCLLTLPCWFLGGLGQLGIECAKLLRGKYGADSVILSDIIKPTRTLTQGGPYIFADILDFKVSKTLRMDFSLFFWNERATKKNNWEKNQSVYSRYPNQIVSLKCQMLRDWNAMLIFTGSSKNRCRSSHRLDNPFFSTVERNRWTKCSVGRQVRWCV